MRIMKSAAFKYTFPISKAEKRDDGYYITGYASGPEVDLEGERMAPEAIERFSTQINSSGVEKLTYRDAHADDGVMRDLGDITKAWVEENFHLGIEVKLDMDNPAASFLFKQVSKGKQYGMSVAGRVLDYADDVLEGSGTVVRTYKNVVLDEISNTTRPAWYPSFGSVLSKSIKDASTTASGEITLGKTNEELLDENVVEDANKSAVVETTEETTEKAAETAETTTEETTEKSSSAANDASSAAYIEASLLALLGGEAGETDDEAPLRVALAAVQQFIAQEATEIGTEADSEDSYGAWSTSDKELADGVAKAGRSLSNANSAKLRELYNTVTETLTGLGVIAEETEEETTSEKSASSDEEDNIVKTETTEATADVVDKSVHDALALDLQKAHERIAELEALPRTQLPGSITDETRKTADEITEVLSKASPSDRMRLAFALQTQGK